MLLRSLMLVTLCIPMMALAETWVDVGADTEAKYYVDTDSIVVEGENTIVQKREFIQTSLRINLRAIMRLFLR